MGEIRNVSPRKVDYYWVIPLSEIDFPVKGIYKTRSGELPTRMKFLHPKAYWDFKRLQRDTDFKLVYSDMYRSFAESLAAKKRKPRLVASPSFSGHNFGVSFDIDMGKAQEVIGKIHGAADATVFAVQQFLAKYGWTHINKESWHFNHVTGYGYSRPWIDATYGDEFNLTAEEIQSALNELGYNVWPIDGDIGPQTEAAVEEFQEDYSLAADGVPGRMTQRILASFAAEIELIDPVEYTNE